MITRNKAKEQHLSLVAHSSTKIMRQPNTTKETLKSPHWLATMQEEIDVLHTNKTWSFVPSWYKLGLLKMGVQDKIKSRWNNR